MADLILNDVEPEIIAALQAVAEREGMAVEEAHRRLLRQVLLGDMDSPDRAFKFYALRSGKLRSRGSSLPH